MRLGYFTMPVHPMHRDWSVTLREDREAIILADKLGFYDAFMGEHLTDRCENVTNSMLFQATLIPETKRIKLATGTANLSQMHPVLIAVQAAMFDHLAQGRFILGVSPGALTSDAEALGILGEDRNKLFAEVIEVILAVWEGEPPYDIQLPENRFKVSTAKTSALHLGVGYLAKPLQKPRPEIVGTVLAPSSPAWSRWAGAISTHYPQTSCWGGISSRTGGTTAGVRPKLGSNRMCATGGLRERFSSLMTTRWPPATRDPTTRAPIASTTGRCTPRCDAASACSCSRTHNEQLDDEITDDILDQLVICGSVNKVVDNLLALRQEAGDFGEIVYAGMDWADPGLAKRSMQLMAEEVMPRVNAAIGASAAK